MEKVKRSHKDKEDSSEEEEDFESADEGEGSASPPSCAGATSADFTRHESSQDTIDNSPKPSLGHRDMDAVETSGSTEQQKATGTSTVQLESAVNSSAIALSKKSSSNSLESTPLVSSSTASVVSDSKGTDTQVEDGEELEPNQNSLDTDSVKESINSSEQPSEQQLIDNQGEQGLGPTTELSSKSNTIQEVTPEMDKDPGKDVSEQSESQYNVKDVDPEEDIQDSSVWGWSTWGSVLSQATASVTSGLSSVIETVETSLGIPEPSEIAHKVSEDEKKAKESADEKEPVPTEHEKEEGATVAEQSSTQVTDKPGSVMSMFGLKSIMQSKGMELMHEGLEALEYLGKKTMDVISEGDPGLRNKREAMRGGQRPNLSQLLRQAKEEAEHKASQQKTEEAAKSVNFSTVFDEHQGLAHLEALEILAKESEAKLEAQIIDLSDERLSVLKPVLRTIQDLLHFSDEEEDESEEQDFETEIQDSLAGLHLTHIPDKITQVEKRSKEWIDECVKQQDDAPGSKEPSEVYIAGISTLAELTAKTVEQFHKIAEVILLLGEKETSAVARAQVLRKLTSCVCTEVSILSNHFAGCLNTAADDSEDPESVNTLITSLYLESSECARYVQHAFDLVGPVLQLSSLAEGTNRT